jgi:hypothetical protein
VVVRSLASRPAFLEKSTRSATQVILGTHPALCRSARSTRDMSRPSERSLVAAYHKFCRCLVWLPCLIQLGNCPRAPKIQRPKIQRPKIQGPKIQEAFHFQCTAYPKVREVASCARFDLATVRTVRASHARIGDINRIATVHRDSVHRDSNRPQSDLFVAFLSIHGDGSLLILDISRTCR